jgi:serine protease Do
MQHNDNQFRPGVPKERHDAPDIYLEARRSEPSAEKTADAIALSAPEAAQAPLPKYAAELAVELSAGYIAEQIAEAAGAADIGEIESAHDSWSEPAYSEAVSERMYSPSIVVKEHRKERAKSVPNKFWRAIGIVAACAVVSAAAAYGAVELRIRSGDFQTVNQVVLGAESAPRPEPASATPDNQPAVVTSGAMSAADIYDIAIQQVVVIRAGDGGMGSRLGGGRVQPGRASGSGFIVSSDGYILTNYHVIEPAYLSGQPIVVYMLDGSSYVAQVIGHDAANDVAVIKIEANGLLPVTIGDSDEIRVGQRVYAVGNPFGDLVYTMTDGIVSALERVVTVEDRTINTFQLSAAVNAGNSGGPVYNTYGEVIGIVTAKLAADRMSAVEGIGFAIPINDAIQIASELIEHGFISGRPRIGVSVTTVSNAVAAYNGWERGAYIVEVNPGSAAEAAGIQAGDIITHLGDERVLTQQELLMRLRRHRAGDTLGITIWRDSEVFELEITFDEAD